MRALLCNSDARDRRRGLVLVDVLYSQMEKRRSVDVWNVPCRCASYTNATQRRLEQDWLVPPRSS